MQIKLGLLELSKHIIIRGQLAFALDSLLQFHLTVICSTPDITSPRVAHLVHLARVFIWLKSLHGRGGAQEIKLKIVAFTEPELPPSVPIRQITSRRKALRVSYSPQKAGAGNGIEALPIEAFVLIVPLW